MFAGSGFRRNCDRGFGRGIEAMIPRVWRASGSCRPPKPSLALRSRLRPLAAQSKHERSQAISDIEAANRDMRSPAPWYAPRPSDDGGRGRTVPQMRSELPETACLGVLEREACGTDRAGAENQPAPDPQRDRREGTGRPPLSVGRISRASNRASLSSRDAREDRLEL